MNLKTRKKDNVSTREIRKKVIGVTATFFITVVLSGCANLINTGVEVGNYVKEGVSSDVPSSKEILQGTQESWKDIDSVEMETLLSIVKEEQGNYLEIVMSGDSTAIRSSSTAYVNLEVETSLKDQSDGVSGKMNYEQYQIRKNGKALSVTKAGFIPWSLDVSATEIQWPGAVYEILEEGEMEGFEVSKKRVEGKSCYKLVGEMDVDRVFSAPGFEDFFQDASTWVEDDLPIEIYIDRETYLPVKLVYKFDKNRDI